MGIRYGLGYCTTAGIGLVFFLTTDCHSAETTLELVDDQDIIVLEAHNFASETTYQFTMCLPLGEYTLYINDVAGNGLQGCNGNFAGYSLTTLRPSKNSGPPIATGSSGSSFDGYELALSF